MTTFSFVFSQNDYLLTDINPSSHYHGEEISPEYFQGQVTLHYFGHQYWGTCTARAGQLNDLYADLVTQGYSEYVKIITIGKSAYSYDNSKWTDSIDIPVLVDPHPYNLWANWGANQWDLFFLDANGNYVTDFNINPWNYSNIYETIMSLINPPIYGCTTSTACNYNSDATDDDGSCISIDGVCETCVSGVIVDNDSDNDDVCDDLAITPLNSSIPIEFSIAQNHPNPFNPSTTISYSIPKFGFTTIKAYDITGKEMAMLLNEILPVGYHSINWDASPYPSGVYFIRMESSHHVESKKVMLVK